jgi:hypothetical protein
MFRTPILRPGRGGGQASDRSQCWNCSTVNVQVRQVTTRRASSPAGHGAGNTGLEPLLYTPRPCQELSDAVFNPPRVS